MIRILKDVACGGVNWHRSSIRGRIGMSSRMDLKSFKVGTGLWIPSFAIEYIKYIRVSLFKTLMKQLQVIFKSYGIGHIPMQRRYTQQHHSSYRVIEFETATTQPTTNKPTTASHVFPIITQHAETLNRRTLFADELTSCSLSFSNHSSSIRNSNSEQNCRSSGGFSATPGIR